MKRNFYFSASLLSLAAAGGALSACQQQPGTPAKPNVILILADDVGYGDLSPYGFARVETPNVQRLAQCGIRFTNAHAVAATSTPSRYSLFTGMYSWRRDDTGIAAGDAGMVIRPEQYTVADLFRDNGYATGAIGKWHLGLSRETGGQDWNGHVTPGPEDIGFSYSYIMAATGDRVPCVWMENQRVVNLDPTDPIFVSYKTPFEGEPLGKDHPELLTKLHPSPNHGHDQAIVNGISRIGYMKGGKSALWEDEDIADTIATKAVSFIDTHKSEPFFLYVGTNDIHVPRWPNERFAGKSGMGPRGDAILAFDWTVGRILDALEQHNLLDNTIVILTSDNGPVVDDGYADQAVALLGNHLPWGNLRGGKYSNFEAGTRVPMIIHWPKGMEGSQAKGSVSPALVSHIDLVGTMASMLQASVPQTQATDSKNALPTWRGKDDKGREYVVESAGSLSLFDGTYKYILPSQGGKLNRLTNIELGNDKEDQLYNMISDIGETQNLASQEPERVTRMRGLLEAEKAK